MPMASFAKDLFLHKCYRNAHGGSVDELKKLLREEKSKNPKRIPYFFSASKQFPGKFCLGYQPGSKPRVEYATVTPDGFRYRNQVHDSVDNLIRWFKQHYQDPVPRPPTATAHGHGGSSLTPSSSVSSSHIPSHITRNLDFSQLQAAVDTATQRNTTGSTPYTPTHLAYSSGTPTPQFGQQQYNNSYNVPGGYPGQGAQAVGGGGGRFGSGTWRSGHGMGWDGGHTPSQTPSHTPLYTPTQTPHSIGSSYGTPTSYTGGTPLRGRDGHAQQFGVAMNKRRSHIEPPGTPVLDE